MSETSSRHIQSSLERHWERLAKEYQSLKTRQSSPYKSTAEFYLCNGLCKKTFLKFFHRYEASGHPQDLLPQKPGPKYKRHRRFEHLEQEALELRRQGLNRYAIHSELKSRHGELVPSPSALYTVFKENGLSRLSIKEKQKFRMIIKEKPGDMGHIDAYYLPRSILTSGGRRAYLLALMDDATRLVWAEIMLDNKALTTTFAGLRLMNALHVRYGIQFKEMMSDNGPEFGGGKQIKNKLTHPFERMLFETGVKHIYTKPYRPQTNGKIERFWRTLKDELLEGSAFKDLAAFENELLQYLLYYNEHRPHQSLDLKTPFTFNSELL